MRVVILGSGAAEPTAERASAGYLVEWSGGAAVLDASAGTYMRALKAGLSPRDLDALLLTHLHPDHTADLAGLLWARRRAGVEEPLALVGPPGTGELLQRFRAVYDGWLETPVTVASYPFERGGLLATAFPARHSPEAVCLRVRADGKVLAFSGDTADCDGLRRACRGADLALIECTSMVEKDGHLTPAACMAVVEEARPRRFLLTHLGPDVATGLPLAADGMEIKL